MAQPARRRPPETGAKEAVAKESGERDRLPVTEFLFDRAGAPSPFGDDQTFPLPVSALAYRHPGVHR
jgi:hypothetical protein